MRLPQRARWLTLLLVGALLLPGCQQHTMKGRVLDPAKPAPELSLTDHMGRPFRLADYRGKVVLLFFGFSTCPDVCPVEMATMAATRRELGAAAEDVQVVVVTVDPARDSPEVFGRYVTAYDPTFLGLVGSAEELAAAYKAYGVTAVKRELAGSALGYTIDHSAYTYLIDRNGQWAEIFGHATPVEDMVADVRHFLSQKAS